MTRQILEGHLASAEEEVRYRAVASLRGLFDPRDVHELLLRALGDASWRVRRAAGESIAALDDRLALTDALISALADDENAGLRNAAAEVLAVMGSDVLDALLRALRSPERDVRKHLVDIIGDIRATRAVEPVVALLSDEDENVRAAAAEALGKIGGDAACSALTGLLGGQDLLEKLTALDALARAGAFLSLETLRPLLSQRLLRRPLLHLLCRLPEDEALTKILEVLGDPSRGTREAALACLGKWTESHDVEGDRLRRALASIEPDAVVRVALAGLEAEELWVRAGSITILGALGDVSAASAILRSAEDERLEDLALTAVRRLGPAASSSLVDSMESLPPSARALALVALAHCDPANAVTVLVRHLDHHDRDVCLAAIEGLVQARSSGAIEPLARLLGWPEELLARAAVRALIQLSEVFRGEVLEACRGRLQDLDARRVADACRVFSALGSSADIPLLRQVLRREEPRAREAAAEALAGVPCQESIVQLLYALADEAPEVRTAAALGLGRLGGQEVTEVLIVALGDEEPSVVGAAATALGEIGDTSVSPRLLSLIEEHGASGGAPGALAALHALVAMRFSKMDDALRQAARHPEGEVAKESVRLAEAMSVPSASSVYLACAAHAAWDVRLAAAKAIERLRDPSLLNAVRQLADSETDEMVAEAMLKALRSLEELVP